MTILCIETSTSVCSAALCVDGVAVEQLISMEGGNHAQLLPRYIDQLLRGKQQLLKAVAVSEGPGSYTGLRIGASMAKGLSYGRQIPLIPIPTLQVLAVSAIESITSPLSPSQPLLCPMLDARRMEVYTALYDSRLTLQRAVEARVVENRQWLEETNRPVYFFGDGAAKCQTILEDEQIHFIPDIVPQAAYMGRLAEQLLAEDRQADVAYWQPFYLKEFEAAQSHVKGLV